MKRVLFVCTGNIFRSMSAEYLLKKYLKDNKIKNWQVSSAGIEAKPENPDPETIKKLKSLGIKNIVHKQRKLTKKILAENDVIISIAKNHQDFIHKNFNTNSILFNELAIEKSESILDIGDEIKDWETNRKAVEEKIDRTIQEIADKIPKLFERMSEKYFLFSDFVEGRQKHRNGFPFIKLHETKNTMTFMSIDIPQKEDGHILVIPKKRYPRLSQIPKQTLNELIQTIAKIGECLEKNNGGYNVLLNNGSEAGQCIFHTHFHIIPRNYNDEITIEDWKREPLSVEEYKRINKILKKQINS